MNLKNIGINIKKIRMSKGMTQAELAEKMDMSTVHMSHIETGNVSMSLECLLNLCKTLEASPDSILLGEYDLSTDNTAKFISDKNKQLTSDECGFLLKVAEILSETKINR